MPPRKSARPPGQSTGQPEITAEVKPAEVLRKFRLVFNEVKAHFQQVEKKAGIGGAQLWALSVVHKHPGIGVNDLARALDIHQSTASNIVRTLVARNLLATDRTEPDRRLVQLQVTDTGKATLKRAPGPFTGVLPAALEQLEPEVLHRLDADLQLLIEVLKPAARGANIPLGQS